MKFSLMFFASDGVSSAGGSIYDLVLDCASFADNNGLHALWLPERHFGRLGAPFPNPATVHAAIAGRTRRLGLRAGSVVAPTHHLTRVAEEWSVVDNLSGGRVGVSLASGWNPDDFVNFPDRYSDRDAYLEQAIGELRRMWAGEPAEMLNGKNESTPIQIHPRPVQPELPLWLTVARSPTSFERAGRLGMNLLTHLLDQDVDSLASGLRLYFDALEKAGHDRATRQVTVMMHTFVSPTGTSQMAAQRVRDAYAQHLTENLGLLAGLSASRGSVGMEAARGLTVDERLELAYGLFDRFAAERSLIGTPESCLPLVQQLSDVGVDEVACLIDFGAQDTDVRAALPGIVRLDELAASGGSSPASPSRIEDEPWRVHFAGMTQVASAAEMFDRAERAGASYGPSMRMVQDLWTRDSEAAAILVTQPDDPMCQWDIHPVVIDNTLLTVAQILPDLSESVPVALPVGMDRIEGSTRGEHWFRSHVKIDHVQDGYVVGDAEIYSKDDRRIASIQGFRLRLIGEPPAPADSPGNPGRTATVAFVTSQPDNWHTCIAELRRQRVNVHIFDTMADVISSDEIMHAEENVDVVLDMTAAEADTWQEHAVRRAAVQAVSDVQTFLRAGVSGRLWWLVDGSPDQSVPNRRSLISGPIWGVARSLFGEAPEHWGGVIEVADPAADMADLATLVTCRSTPRTDQVRLMAGGPDPVFFDLPNAASGVELQGAERPCDFSGTVLVTGGTGAVGLALARSLVDRAGAIVLVSRSGKFVEDGGDGAEPDRFPVLTCDVADAHLVNELPAQISALGLPEVTAIVHAAGVADGALLRDMTGEQVEQVMRPKAQGALHLYETFANADFCLIGAIPAVIAPVAAGGANYAAANAFLDSFALFQEASGTRSRVIHFGPWAERGLASRGGAIEQLARFGVDALSEREAVAAFEAAVDGAPVRTIATRIDWVRLISNFPQMQSSRHFETVMTPSAEKQHSSEVAELVLSAIDSDIPAWVNEQMADITGLLPTQVDPDVPLNEMGVDSLMAIEFRARARSAFAIAIPMVELLRGPTVTGLCKLIEELATTSEDAPHNEEEIIL